MARNEGALNVREAGLRIADAGLDREVIHADEGQIARRRGNQREAAEEEGQSRVKRKPGKSVSLDDDPDTGDDENDTGEEEASNREAGDDIDDASDDTTSSDDASDGDDTEDDADTGRADPLEAEYTVKVNGREARVTARELVSGYQRTQDYHQKTQALAGKTRELTAGHAKVAETYARKLQQAGAVTASIRQLLIGDVNSAEMEHLKRSDPQAWMVARTDMQDRISKVDTVLNAITQEHERHVGEFKNQHTNLANATLSEERELLTRAIPDWDGEGRARLAGYLGRAGFTADELANVVDSRTLIVADKARRWDAYQASRSKDAKRVVKNPPKSLKPGSGDIKRNGTQAPGMRQNDFRRVKQHAAKTGDMRDAGKAIARMLK
ncbi:MAG: hypothetical protein WC790_00375 [Candidatus Paceibacterota bacterium]|jgi:hypothetical protein